MNYLSFIAELRRDRRGLSDCYMDATRDVCKAHGLPEAEVVEFLQGLGAYSDSQVLALVPPDFANCNEFADMLERTFEEG